jgi:hypothetical protein
MPTVVWAILLPLDYMVVDALMAFVLRRSQ